MKVPGTLPAILALRGSRPAIYSYSNGLTGVATAEGIGVASQGNPTIALDLSRDHRRLQRDRHLAQLKVCWHPSFAGLVAGGRRLVFAAAVATLLVVEQARVLHALIHLFGLSLVRQSTFLATGTDVALDNTVPPRLSLGHHQMNDTHSG
jgi:hypothetical protein